MLSETIFRLVQIATVVFRIIRIAAMVVEYAVVKYIM